MGEADTQSVLVDQPFATSEMGDSMDADLLPELSGETWVASALLDELTGDLQPARVNNDLVSATSEDKMVRSWVESGNAPPWPECAGLAPELRCWRLQIGNLKVDSLGRLWRRRSPPSVGSQLVVPAKKNVRISLNSSMIRYLPAIWELHKRFSAYSTEYTGQACAETFKHTFNCARFA